MALDSIEYDSTINLSSDFYKKICEELYTLSHTVNIRTKKSYASFGIENQDIKGEISIRDNNSVLDKLNEQCEIICKKNIDLDFLIKYLCLFSKVSSFTYYLTINLAEEYPLMIEYNLDKLGVIRFYLAPRIVPKPNEKKIWLSNIY